MKYLVISDIHGDIDRLNDILEIYKNDNIDYLIILGDFAGYFHSSKDFDVAETLNNMAGRIIAVRGNCDNEELKNMLSFSLDYIKHININGVPATITHGHIYDRYSILDFKEKIFISGHTHFGIIEKDKDRIILNPGSISKPRNGSKRSYILIDEENIYLKTLNGEILKKVKYI